MVVAGEDCHLRLPFINKLRALGLNVALCGSNPSFDQGDEYFFFGLSRFFSPFKDLRTIFQLYSIFRNYKPDIVHAFDTKAAIYSMFAAKCARVPVRIKTVNGMGRLYTESAKPDFKSRCMRLVYQLLQKISSYCAHYVVFQNADDQLYFLQEKMSEAGNSRVILSSGIDAEDFQTKLANKKIPLISEQKDERLVFLMVSRLLKSKGVFEYLDAAKALSERYSNLKFLLVGGYAAEGADAISKNTIEAYSDCVQYLGVRQDVPQIMQQADVFVFPSYYREGVPRVLLEAGLSELPSITTDMPGCKDVVVDGKNGWLVNIRSAEDIINKMEFLLDLDKNQIRNFGKEAKRIVTAKFNLDFVVSQYADLYGVNDAGN